MTDVRRRMFERPDRLRLAVEALLVALILVQVVGLVWILAKPQPRPAPPTMRVIAPADLSILQRFDAFFRAGVPQRSPDGLEASGAGLRLFGLRADGAGGGSAIIGLPDGRQVSVGAGELVAPGQILQTVGADFVILSQSGQETRLTFDPMAGAAPPPPPAPETAQVVAPPAPITPVAAPVAASGPPVDVPAMISQASLRPRLQGLRLNGFVVGAGAASPLIRAAGLQPGDVILAVNGQALDSPGSLVSLRRDLANRTGAEVRIERAGVVQTLSIGTGR